MYKGTLFYNSNTADATSIAKVPKDSFHFLSSSLQVVTWSTLSKVPAMPALYATPAPQ